jgi:DNA-binding beta-propeller fold protein YncE
MTLRLAATVVLALPLVAVDFSKVPKLPHKLVPEWAQLPAGWNFGEASGVAVDSTDHVWVFHRGSHPVIRLDKNGKFVSAWSDVPVTASHGIRADGENNIWLVDVKGNAVMKFSPFGRLLMVITNAGRVAGDNESRYAFHWPTGVAFAANGDFYVSDGYENSRVVQYNAQGEYIRHWGRKGTGDGEFNLVHDVAVDKQGRVYVADRTNGRIQVFDANGKFLAKWTDIGNPWGLVYAEKENAIYMCDGQQNRVVKFNLDGQVLGAMGEFGKAPGKFDFAHNIAIDSEGSLYVVEIKNWRVQKFVPPAR